jgi:hypothetical protein
MQSTRTGTWYCSEKQPFWRDVYQGYIADEITYPAYAGRMTYRAYLNTSFR